MIIKAASYWDKNKKRFTEGELRIRDGRFCECEESEIPLAEERIEFPGAFITAGLIDAHSHLGMWEEGLGTEGADGNETTDPLTPQVRAIDGINPMDAALSEALRGGVTTVASGPGSTNPMGGQWLAMKTAGRVLDRMVLNPYLAQKCALGENPKRCYASLSKAPVTRMGTASMIRTILAEAVDYDERLKAAKTCLEKPAYNAKLEALRPVIRGEIPLKVHAHRADDILTAIRIGKEFKLKMTLDHCTEGHLIAEAIAESGYPVIVGPTFGFRSKVELREKSFATVKSLLEQGILLAIMTDHPVLPQDSLRLWAIAATTYGVSPADALAIITSNPARILGLDYRVGSLEAGKDADFVVWDRHPLEPMAEVLATFIEGKCVYRKKHEKF